MDKATAAAELMTIMDNMKATGWWWSVTELEGIGLGLTGKTRTPQYSDGTLMHLCDLVSTLLMEKDGSKPSPPTTANHLSRSLRTLARLSPLPGGTVVERATLDGETVFRISRAGEITHTYRLSSRVIKNPDKQLFDLLLKAGLVGRNTDTAEILQKIPRNVLSNVLWRLSLKYGKNGARFTRKRRIKGLGHRLADLLKSIQAEGSDEFVVTAHPHANRQRYVITRAGEPLGNTVPAPPPEIAPPSDLDPLWESVYVALDRVVAKQVGDLQKENAELRERLKRLEAIEAILSPK